MKISKYRPTDKQISAVGGCRPIPKEYPKLAVAIPAIGLAQFS
jgi:hypothetical protein